MKDRMVERFGHGVLKRSALNLSGGEEVFDKVLKGKGYNHIVEIGTYKGAAAAYMSQYANKVTTFDLNHGRLEQLNDPFSRQELWSYLGIDNVYLVLVDDNKDKFYYLRSMDFDFAFIDGAHDETVMNDFENVKRCGHVLFHDYADRGQPCLNHVYDFVNSLPKEQIQIMDGFALWTDPCM